MIKLLILTLAIWGLSAADTKYADEFDKYARKQNKKYNSPSEKAYRYTIFSAKKKEIDDFNKGKNSYTKDVNQFSDLTTEERLKYLGAYFKNNNKGYGKPLTEFKNSVSVKGSNERLLQTTTLDGFTPRNFDWVSKGKVSSVKDQGQCGSCWAFAVIATTESYYLKQNKSYNLSEQELVDCTRNYGNYGCSGGLLRNTLDYIYNKKISTEAAYPYTAKDGSCRAKRTGKISIPNYYYVNPGYMSNLLYAITMGPVAVTYAVADSFFDYSSGVYDAKAGCPSDLSFNHAVLAVGFDLDFSTPFIRFKNQWGTTWGENGYFRMSFENIDAQNGPCNLVSHSENTIVYQ